MNTGKVSNLSVMIDVHSVCKISDRRAIDAGIFVIFA